MGINCNEDFKKSAVYKIYPNDEQKEMIEKTFRYCNYLYNYFIDWNKDQYSKDPNNADTGYFTFNRKLIELKRAEQYGYLKEVDSTALSLSLKDLSDAYVLFYKGISKYPRYKSNKDRYQSYRTYHASTIRIENHKIKVPKIGWVDIFDYRNDIPYGKRMYICISRDNLNDYYCSIHNVSFEPELLPKTSKSIGIDVGIKHLCTLSDGTIIDNPKYLNKSLKAINKKQAKLSSIKKGTHKYEKQRIKLAKMYKKTYNQRKDFIHKLSTQIVNDYDLICIEDLDINDWYTKNKGHDINRSINDAGLGEFRRQLMRKAKWYGKTVIEAPKDYPSTQMCSRCGCINSDISLNTREWICPNCNAILDRDINAAINLEKYGIERTIDSTTNMISYNQSYTEYPYMYDYIDNSNIELLEDPFGYLDDNGNKLDNPFVYIRYKDE